MNNGFIKYYDDAIAFAKYLTRNATLAEDLVQSAFLRLNDKELTGEQNYKSYLFTTVKSEYLNHLHKKKLDKNAGIEVPVEKAYGVAEDSKVIEDMLGDLLRKAIDDLDRKLAIPLVLSVVYDYQYDEIAKIMDIPGGTVQSRIWTAKKQLQCALS